MTIDEAVDRLRSLRARMPELLGRHWSQLEPWVADRLARLETSQNDWERYALVEDLIGLLAPYGAIRDELAPILGVLDDAPIGYRALDEDTPPASDGRPAMIRHTPHMDIHGPQPLAAGDRFTVDVYLDAEAFRPGESGSSILVPDIPLLQLRVWLIASDHFRVLGQETAIITVRRGEDRSSTVTFEAEYLGPAEGDPGLTATFAYNGRPAGSVRRLVSADAAPAAGHVVVDPGAREPDLVVRLTNDPDGDRRHFVVLVTSPLLDEYAEGVAGKWRLDADPKQIVERYMEAFTTSTPGGRKAALIGAGKALFRAAPKVFKDAFWALVDADEPLESIFVVSEEELIPWELMIPVRDGVARPPLGVEFAFGRWPHEDGVSPKQVAPLEDSWVIAPSYDGDRALEFAEAEARYVIETFRGRRISPAYLLTIDTALAGRGATLLHFVGHGFSGSAGQTLALDPDEELIAVGLEGLEGVAAAVGGKHPVVFLNACEIGRSAPALVGADGFPAAFARLGASCVIAPLWSVDDAAAEVVARDFYEAIHADPRKPFATVLAGIRARSYEGVNPPDSYAAYCFYGDPLASQAV